jgi:hypothetical protein
MVATLRLRQPPVRPSQDAEKGIGHGQKTDAPTGILGSVGA